MKLYFLFIFFLLPLLLTAQNLLVNGSFENENICTEYHEPCAPEGWFGNTGGFRNYFVDSATAYDGSHYLAIEAGRTRNKYQRSYTRTQLLCNLRKGNQYKVQFFLKAPTNILDSFGIYFTPTDFLFDRNLLHQLEPTAYVIDQNKPDSSNHDWQKINFIYTANGEEKFLTIANFSRRDINEETGIPNEIHFFAYLDVVTLLPVNPDEKLCGDWQAAKTLIYEMNDRHEYFERYVRFYRSQYKVAPPPKLSLTRLYKSQKLVLKDELFVHGRSNLTTEGYSMVDNFCRNLTRHSVDEAEVTTYANAEGDAIGTDEISVQRGALIKEYIRRKLGIEEKQIKINGEQPGKTSLKQPSAKPGKRRIELIIYRHE